MKFLVSLFVASVSYLSYKYFNYVTPFWQVNMDRQLIWAYMYKEGVEYPKGARLVREEDLPKPYRVIWPHDHSDVQVEDPNRLTVLCYSDYQIWQTWFG